MARIWIGLIAAAIVFTTCSVALAIEEDESRCRVEAHIPGNAPSIFAGEKAIAACDRAIALDPKNFQLYLARGQHWLSMADCDKGIADLQNAASAMTSNSLYLRGICFKDQGKNDLAIKDFNFAIGQDPSFGKAYYQRGLVWERASQVADGLYWVKLENAVSDFKRSAEFEPLASDATKAIARVEALFKQGAQIPVASNTVVRPQQQAVVQVLLPVTTLAKKGRRIALVIGNSKYKNAPLLPNPQRDAAVVADALRRTGFAEVTLHADLSREAMASALQKFARSADTADWAVVYFAGHGMEIGGINYLIPVDATLETDREVQFQAVPLNQVLDVVGGASKLRLVVLDACRSNPFASSMKRQIATRAVERGFVRVDPTPGTLVVYAAKDGEVASDGSGSNSPFSLAFAKNIQTPGIDITKTFRLVYDDVMEATANKQSPYTYGALSGRQDFYFVEAK